MTNMAMDKLLYIVKSSYLQLPASDESTFPVFMSDVLMKAVEDSYDQWNKTK